MTGLLILALFAYLGLFAWNARTGYLDALAERSGLEVVSHILSPVTWVKETTKDYWKKYVHLINVAEENEFLKKQLALAHLDIVAAVEDRAELHRLQQILELQVTKEQPVVLANVIAARFGLQSVLKTITINKGFLQGAIVGTPVIAPNGAVVGRVNRASPNAANVLLITDPSFSVAVIAQESRTPGMLSGNPQNSQALTLNYVPQTANITVGENLITSGLDGVFPNGITVGTVTEVLQDNNTLFQIVSVTPKVDPKYLEDVFLLLPHGTINPLAQKFPEAMDPNILRMIHNNSLENNPQE